MFSKTRIIIFLFLFFITGIFFIFKYSRAETSNLNADIKISVCGNFVMEGGEECDNYDFGSQSCSTYGYSSGSLSCNADCTIDATGCYDETTPTNPGGGGGGGGSTPPASSPTGINISGRAFPLSQVTILKDGQIAASTIAGPDSLFSLSLTSLSAGYYNFAVYSEDENNIKSAMFVFNIYIISGAMTSVSGIFIAPTISVDQSQVPQGEIITIFGQSTKNADISIQINSEETHIINANSDSNGIYLSSFDTTPLEEGNHTIKSRASLANEYSPFSKSLGLLVGDESLIYLEPNAQKSDINNDGHINLIDFSIVAYWYQRPNPPDNVDLNGDGQVNLIDLSIMAYYWTG